MTRRRVAVRRLASAIVTLGLVSFALFLVARITPGDPLAGTDEVAARGASADTKRELRALYGLDRPVLPAYGSWLAAALRGDLGRSFHDRRPVVDKIAERLPLTVLLNTLVIALTLAVAVPLGTWAALHPRSPADRWTAAATYSLYAVPVFWAALMLQLLFAARLDWLPLMGVRSDSLAGAPVWKRAVDVLAHLVLPVLSLSYGSIAYVSRFVRATLLEGALPDAARAARARGLGRTEVLVRHGFRQAAIPLLTLAGFLVPALVSGSVLVERVFAIPGLGGLLYDAVLQRDLPVVLGVTLLTGVATVAGVALADTLYAVLDPRVRRG